MKVEILDEAQEDLIQGSHFYENWEPGLRSYSINYPLSDVDSLLVYAGIHQVVFTYHRCLSKRFLFAIYYSIEKQLVRVHAVLDCRRNPSWIRKRLKADV